MMKYGFRVLNAMGMAKTPQQGANTVVYCAVHPQLAGVSGLYYNNCRPTQPSQLAMLANTVIAGDQAP